MRYVSDGFSAAYSFLTGLDNAWIYYKGSAVPVQMRYTTSLRRSHGEIEWIYYARSNTWIHGDTYYHRKAKHIPWILCSFTRAGEEYDISEFVTNQSFYMPTGRVVWPSPLQLMSAWSIKESGAWFIGNQTADIVMHVMGMDCCEYEFGVTLSSPADRIAYWTTFGDSYTPMEQSTENSEYTTETEEGEEDDREEEETEEDDREEEETEETEEGEEGDDGKDESETAEEETGDQETDKGDKDTEDGGEVTEINNDLVDVTAPVSDPRPELTIKTNALTSIEIIKEILNDITEQNNAAIAELAISEKQIDMNEVD
jgi:hypothetical protein